MVDRLNRNLKKKSLINVVFDERSSVSREYEVVLTNKILCVLCDDFLHMYVTLDDCSIRLCSKLVNRKRDYMYTFV